MLDIFTNVCSIDSTILRYNGNFQLPIQNGKAYSILQTFEICSYLFFKTSKYEVVPTMALYYLDTA